MYQPAENGRAMGSPTTMTTEELLQQIKIRLQSAHGDRLRGVVLYGSLARGDAHLESDVDILVLLDGNVEYGRDLLTNLEALYPLALEIGRRISAKPAPLDEYETAECPLYHHVREEGIAT